MILQVTERIEHEDEDEPRTTLTLAFDQRQKSRLRARLDDGREVALRLPRGTVLRHGDRLCAEDGLVIAVLAAREQVSTAFTRDPRLLARACYHLGNRHVPLEIGESWLRYLHDHVLDGLVEALGLKVFVEAVPFEPETGAYHGPAQAHGPAHDPPHD